MGRRTLTSPAGNSRKRLALCALLVALAAEGQGCRKGESTPQTCADAGVKAFGQACALDCECASRLCAEFGDGSRACSLRCTDASECPSGSRGQKCNQQGLCRT